MVMCQPRSRVLQECLQLAREKKTAAKYGGAVSSTVMTRGYPSVATIDGKKYVKLAQRFSFKVDTRD